MGGRHMPKTSIASRHFDTSIDNMIYLQEQGIKKVKLSKAMTRPAYQYTKAEQKTIHQTPTCESCGYYREPDEGKDKDCTFPWFEPEDYDLAAFDYLPCKEGLTNEME